MIKYHSLGQLFTFGSLISCFCKVIKVKLVLDSLKGLTPHLLRTLRHVLYHVETSAFETGSFLWHQQAFIDFASEMVTVACKQMRA